MLKYSTLLLFISMLSLHASAQKGGDSVKAVINQMFLAMKESDTAALNKVFSANAVLQTIVSKGDSITVQDEPLAEFIKTIGSIKAGDADERIVFDEIETDGPLAMVWTPYSFYYKGKFSHCGVNSFQLVKINGSWKIQYIIDTRRKQGCN